MSIHESDSVDDALAQRVAEAFTDQSIPPRPQNRELAAFLNEATEEAAPPSIELNNSIPLRFLAALPALAVSVALIIALWPPGKPAGGKLKTTVAQPPKVTIVPPPPEANTNSDAESDAASDPQRPSEKAAPKEESSAGDAPSINRTQLSRDATQDAVGEFWLRMFKPGIQFESVAIDANRELVAVVHGLPLYLDQLQSPEESWKGEALGDSEFEDWQKETHVKALAGLIFVKLGREYRRRNRILLTPEEQTAAAAERNPKLAPAVLLDWKMTRALHAEFGGRVGVSSFGGYFALDAMLRLARIAAEKGDLKFHDQSLQAGFWKYSDDTMPFVDAYYEGARLAEILATPPLGKLPSSAQESKAKPLVNFADAFRDYVLDRPNGRSNLARVLARLTQTYSTANGSQTFEAYQQEFVGYSKAIDAVGIPQSIRIADKNAPIPPSLLPHAGGVRIDSYHVDWTKFAGELSVFVDVVAGDQIFEAVLDGIQNDPNGPKVDIRTELLRHFSGPVYLRVEDAETKLAAIAVDDAGVVAATIESLFSVDPLVTAKKTPKATIYTYVRNDEKRLFTVFDGLLIYGIADAATKLLDSAP